MLRDDFRAMALNSKILSVEETNLLTLDDLYQRLIVDMKGMAHIGATSFRIFVDQLRQYGLDDDTPKIKSAILKKLEDDGFTVNSGKTGILVFGLSYIEVQW